MRILVLGGTGMLGHKLVQVCQQRFETWTTLRSSCAEHSRYGIFDPQHTLGGVDAFIFDSVIQAIATVRPDVVINCIGIIKQLPAAQNPIISLTVNSLFPQRLAVLCKAAGTRLIHISTDCVFSGHKGMYTENDISDAEDLYGRTKFLGEVADSHCLTLRTSMIGRELSTSSSLVEWFLNQEGKTVRGYTEAIYSGLSSLALANLTADLIQDYPYLSGLYHVSSEPINKYDLLCLLRDAYKAQVEIEKYPAVHIDRSLDSSCFREQTRFIPLSWPDMIHEMMVDSIPYLEWRCLQHETRR